MWCRQRRSWRRSASRYRTSSNGEGRHRIVDRESIGRSAPESGERATTRRLLVLAAPSGAGKTTIAHRLLERHPAWRFSISATTRQRRPGEIDGVDYHFLARDEFERRIAQGDLIEYEEIFGNYYGTLKSQIVRFLEIDRVEQVVFDVDVKGAFSIRQAFPDDAFLCFIAPPSKKTLEERLRRRKTETPQSIAIRLARVDMEMAAAQEFDAIVVNDDLDRAVEEVEKRLNAEG